MSIQINPASLLARGTAAVAGVVLLAGCSAPGAASAAPSTGTGADVAVTTAASATIANGGSSADRSDSDTEDANADAISRLFAAAFPDPTSDAATSAVLDVVAPDATAHGSGAKAGPSGLLSEFQDAHTRIPGAKAVVKHIAADGDLVAVHWQITANPDDERSGEAAVDLFRFTGGKVTEQWTFDQKVPTGTPSSGNTNTMFSDLYTGGSGAELSEQQEETQRTFAVDAYDTLFKAQDPSVLDRDFDPNYLQHNSVLPNGTAALKGFFSGGSKFPPQEATISVSDGDLVWVFSQSVGAKADDPYLAADIFRVDRGLIREHWDVVPAAPAS